MNLGSARVSRAGERALANANFSYSRLSSEVSKSQGKVRFRRDAKTNTRDAFATRSQIAAPGFSLSHASLQDRARVFAIEFGNETGADFRGTNRFAFIGVRAVAEAFCVHLPHHFRHP
jgi:hypothetical protein